MQNIRIIIGVIMFVVWYVIFFIKFRPKKTTINELEDFIKQLLNANPENRGFIVIEGSNKNEFVQFALEKYGLILTWPNVKAQEENLEKAKKFLLAMGYNKCSEEKITREIFENLKYRELVQDAEGIYANAGNNSSEIKELTRSLFKEIFPSTDLYNLKVELVLKN